VFDASGSFCFQRATSVPASPILGCLSVAVLPSFSAACAMGLSNGVTQVASALPRAGFEPYVEVRRTTTKDPRLTVGKAEYGTILGDYRIDETEVSAEISEVREDSTGRDDDNDSADTCLGDGRLDAGR
jgi:hypothetical protein